MNGFNIFVTLLQHFQGQTLISLVNFCTTTAVIVITKTDTKSVQVPVSVLKISGSIWTE